jgi:hypothetical protein
MAEEKSLADIVVGDRFWLSCAQDMVKAAISAPDQRAEQLTTAVAWFWSIYSAAALVVFTTRKLPVAIAIPLALPIVLLIAAYWFASRVRVPIHVEFDPRVPSEIEAVHRQAASQKRHLLAWAERFTGLAAACVVVAVMAAVFTESPSKPDFYGYTDRQVSGKLLVGGAFPGQAIVRVQVEPVGTVPSPAKDISQVYRASEGGELHTQLDVPPARAYRVTAGWNEDKIEKTITIQVKRDSQ